MRQESSTKNVTKTTAEVTHTYVCGVCETRFSSAWKCRDHEWEEHYKRVSETHSLERYGVAFDFIYLASEGAFDTWLKRDNREATWKDSGWYLETSGEDRHGRDYRGLRYIEDVDWITRPIRKLACDIDDFEFGIEPDCPATFDAYSMKWRRRSVYVQDQSIEIRYATDEAEPAPSRERVIAAWQVWRSRQ